MCASLSYGLDGWNKAGKYSDDVESSILLKSPSITFLNGLIKPSRLILNPTLKLIIFYFLNMPSLFICVNDSILLGYVTK